MARQKRTSPALDSAQIRRNALSSIDPALDLGSGLTIATFGAAIDSLSARQQSYNDLLAQADSLLNDIKADEKALSTLSARMLAGVKVKYGPDSSEYEMAGGTRQSEIARKPRQNKTTPAN